MSNNLTGATVSGTFGKLVQTVGGLYYDGLGNLLDLGGSASIGPPGTSGTSGLDGSSGTSGTSGTSGLDGSSGTSGTSGTDGTNGISGGQILYINTSTTQSIGTYSYNEISIIATGASESTATASIPLNSTVTLASYLTPINYPNITNLNPGIWSFYLHCYRDPTDILVDIFCEVYKIDITGVETLLFSTDPVIVPTTLSMITTDTYQGGSTLVITDRLVVKVKVINSLITSIYPPPVVYLKSEDSVHYSFIQTTLAYFSGTSGTSGTSGLGFSNITGSTNYLPKFSSATGLTNSLIYDDGTNVYVGTTTGTGLFNVVGTKNATVAIARGTYIAPTLVASANNDVLVGLDIAPTFTNGAFTGVRNYPLRLPNDSQIGLAGATSYSMYFDYTETAINSPLASGILSFQIGNVNRGRFFPTTGNLLLQNGGTFSDNTVDRLQVSGSSRTIGLTVQGTTSTNGGLLGSELLTTGTGTNWTGTSFATGYTHTIGSTATLTSTLVAVVNNYYQITYTVTNRTTGSFTIGFGGYSYGSITTTGALGPQVTTNDTLVITPTTDFNGTIVLSIKVITTGSPSVSLLNSSGGASLQMRALTDTNSLSIGTNAGLRVTSGLSNLFLGNSAGASTTSGFENVYMGSNAGSKNTVGLYNVAIGNLALTNNRTGIRNLAIGRTALYSSVGGSTNIGIGAAALYDMITGDGNTAIGSAAGAVISTGAVLTGLSNSILIGNNTKPLANNDNNEIVIGSGGAGLGSNTTVIGNSSTTATAIYGDLLLGTNVDNGTDKLQVNGISRTIGLKVQGTTLTDGGQLGVELLTTGTGTNWTGTSFSTGYTHTTGSTATLTSTLAAAINNYYQIEYTVTNRTAGSFGISFGGYSITTLTATGVVGPMATTTGTLVVTPTTDFDGTVVLSIKAITNGTPSVSLLNSDGVVSSEINISKITSNVFFGTNAGRRNTTGNINVGIGFQALLNNTTGFGNTSIGFTSLSNNSTGQSNTATGFNSLLNNTTGNFNISNGYQALQNNTNASANIGIGYQALMNNISGIQNIAIGFLAGRYISGGIVTNTNTTTSIYIGGSTKPLADNQRNQIVIGYNSDGLGSNTTVIGNSSTLSTGIYGNLLLGTIVDNTVDKLQVNGTSRTVGLKVQGTTLTDGGQLGTELLTTGTGTNWTGTSFATGYTHIIGSAIALTSTLAAVVNNYYQITYTVTGRTAGSFTIGFGGYSVTTLTATGAVGPRTTTTGTLVVTPTTDFDGTIVLSIKIITLGNASISLLNSDGVVSSEINISKITSNTFIGLGTGKRNTTGIQNLFIGPNAGQNNTSGPSNLFLGNNTGQNNTAGGNNTFVGISAGNSNTTGNQNLFLGLNAGFNNTTGGFNSFIGIAAGRDAISGNFNSFIGHSAGRFLADKITPATIVNNSILLGYNASPLANSQTNQIVIGHDATGLGSNTTVLGNSTTVTTAIYGRTLFGSITDDGTSQVQITGSLRITNSNETSLIIERTGGSNANIQFKNDSGIMYVGARTGASFGIGSTQDLTTTSQLTVFGNTGNVVIQNGGSPTDTGYRLDVSGTTRLNGQVIVTGGLTASTLAVTALVTGGLTASTLAVTAVGATAGLTRYLVLDNSGDVFYQPGVGEKGATGSTGATGPIYDASLAIAYSVVFG